MLNQGVSLKDTKGGAIDAVEGMLRLADSVQGMGKEEAIFRIKELGITDNRTVKMVLKGRQELEKLLKTQKEQGVITKESAEKAIALKAALGGLGNATDSLSRDFMNAVIGKPATPEQKKTESAVVDSQIQSLNMGLVNMATTVHS